MTKVEFLKNEEANFKDYLDSLYAQHGEKLNYFEHNLEVVCQEYSITSYRCGDNYGDVLKSVTLC